MSKRILQNLVIENADIQFRNFSGKAGKFNPEGNRNFVVFLDADVAETLKSEGWNVKWLKPRDEEEEEQAYLPVALNYNEYNNPKVILVSRQGKTLLTEDTVGMLDWVDIRNADIVINPYEWEVNGKSGIKAYVLSLYVTIVEDELAHKYENVPDNALDIVCTGDDC